MVQDSFSLKQFQKFRSKNRFYSCLPQSLLELRADPAAANDEGSADCSEPEISSKNTKQHQTAVSRQHSPHVCGPQRARRGLQDAAGGSSVHAAHCCNHS